MQDGKKRKKNPSVTFKHKAGPHFQGMYFSVTAQISPFKPPWLTHLVHPPLNLFSFFFYPCAFLRSDSMSCSRPQTKYHFNFPSALPVLVRRRKTWSVHRLPGRVFSPRFTWGLMPFGLMSVLHSGLTSWISISWLLKCRQQLHHYDDVA